MIFQSELKWSEDIYVQPKHVKVNVLTSCTQIVDNELF